MKRYLFAFGLVCIFLVTSCENNPAATKLSPTITANPTSTQTEIPASTPTPTPVPTLFGGIKADRLIAYMCETENICISALDGSNEVNLTSSQSFDPLKFIYPIGWTPDGKWFMYVAEVPCKITQQSVLDPDCDLRGQVWISSPDGKNQKFLFTMVANQQIWFSQSTKFTLNCPDDRQRSGICIYDINNFSLTDTGLTGEIPHFSPDGSTLAWIDVQGDKARFTYTIKTLRNGETTPKELVVIPQDQSVNGGTFIWSPDSQSIYYSNSNGTKLFNTNLDGSINEQLLDLSNTNGGLNLLYGSFSPDGKFLSFMNGVFNLSTKTAITDISGIWTPNGKLVDYEYDSSTFKIKGFFLVDPNTGQKEDVDLDQLQAYPRILEGLFLLQP